MPSKKEDLRDAEAKPDPDINFTYNDFWNELYKDVPIMLQPGEKTVSMMIEEIGRAMEFDTMKRNVNRWVKEGKLISVGTRLVKGRHAQAYRRTE
jgi:hypothetical protein